MQTADRLRRVSSRDNALVKSFRACFARDELTPDGYCAIESVRVVEEAIRSGLKFKAAIFSDAAIARAERILPQLAAHVDTVVVTDEIFRSAVATDSPQGVAALVKLKEHSLDDALRAREPLLVCLAGLQDPGNLGTIVRSAEAFGATAVVLGTGTVSPYNAKAIRAAAGSLFRLPVLREDLRTLLPALRERGLRVAATSSHKGVTLPEAELTGGLALVVGGEGAGVPKDVLANADLTIAIPHSERVESLNAGVAASVVLYEIARQRAGIK